MMQKNMKFWAIILFLAVAAIPSNNAESGGSVSRQEYMKMIKKCKMFQINIILPLVKKCQSMGIVGGRKEGKGSVGNNEGNVVAGERKEMFCKFVDQLKMAFGKLVKLEKNLKPAQVEHLFEQVQLVVLDNTIDLDIYFSKKIPAKDAKEGWLNVGAGERYENDEGREGTELEMQFRENYNEHFKQIVGELKEQLAKKGEGAETALMEKVAYEILQISKFMTFVFDWSPLEKIDYAMQQIAANTMILAIRGAEGVDQMVGQVEIGMDQWVKKDGDRRVDMLNRAKQFSKEIITPLLGGICHAEKEGSGGTEQQRERQILCESVAKMREPIEALAKMDTEYILNRANHENVRELFEQIHQVVLFDDIVGLDLYYAELIDAEEAKRIWIEIASIGMKKQDKLKAYKNVYQQREDLNRAYVEEVKKFKAHLGKSAGGVGGKGEEKELRRMGYRIVQIAKYMGFEFEWSQLELLDWAFQQFAANLRVYGLGLTEVQAIGNEWKIGMDEWVQ